MSARRIGRLALSGVLAATLSLCTVASTAHAADTDAPFWADKYGVEAAHAAGLTGKGVKIAVIDTQINPDLPVFAGRDLTVSDAQICEEPTDPVSTDPTFDVIHGTTVAAMLIGNGTGGGGVQGMAPDASVRFYGYGPQTGVTCRLNQDHELSQLGIAVKTAVDDGADIITTSVGYSVREGDAPAIAYALARGVVVITSEPNAGQLADTTTDTGTYNGVVAASQIDREGALQTDTDGSAFVIPQTTVVAAGKDLPSVGTEGDWNGTFAASGSSLAAPTVAGMLALAAQKTPQATGNQLVQALVATTNASVHEPTRTEDGFGYGAAWLKTLLTVDPTQYPDETPLMGESAGKTAGMPTQEQIDTAKADGFVPMEEAPFTNLQYSDTESSSSFDLTSLIPWIVGALVVLVLIPAVVLIFVFVIVRRRKAAKGSSS